jgi:hypothetical protein
MGQFPCLMVIGASSIHVLAASGMRGQMCCATTTIATREGDGVLFEWVDWDEANLERNTANLRTGD